MTNIKFFVKNCSLSTKIAMRIYSQSDMTFTDRKERNIVNRTYHYARVSSSEQNLDRQLEAFKNMGADEREIITDKASGKNLECSDYQALKGTILRRGDTLVVKSLDRLSRNKADIKGELEYFKSEGIRLKVLDLSTTLIELPL